MTSSHSARLASTFREAIELQKAGKHFEMSELFDKMDAELPAESDLRGTPMIFFDSWADEATHGFPGFYKGIEKETWPELAAHIADALESNGPLTDERLKKFASDREIGRISFSSVLWGFSFVLLMIMFLKFVPVFSDPRTPSLGENLPSNPEAAKIEFDRRAKAHFTEGIQEGVMLNVLKTEGYALDRFEPEKPRLARWTRRFGDCFSEWNITWQVDDSSKVRNVRGEYWNNCK